MMIKKHRTCDQLGVCQGLGADHCPDCDAWECDVRCAPHPGEAAQPTYPFAPGIIEGPPVPGGPFDAPWGVSLKDAAIILVMAALCAGAAGLLVGWISGWPK